MQVIVRHVFTYSWSIRERLGFPGSSVGKESACKAGDPGSSWVRKIPWRRDRLPTPVFQGFPCGSAGKESAHNAGDLGSIPGLERCPGGGLRLPTPIFWPGEFHKPYSPWGCKEADITQQLSLCFQLQEALLHTCSFFRSVHPNPRTGAQVEAISLPSTSKFKQLLQFYGIRGEEREGRSYSGVEKLQEQSQSVENCHPSFLLLPP